jgi:LemA protein
MNYSLIICLGIIVLLVIIVVSIYNKLIGLKNRMQEAWSTIDVCLKKRHDLIPNLVETVKGYAAHEKNTLVELTRYRSEAMQAKDRASQMESENNLGKALMQFFAVVENYPDLKANANFLDLQHQLTDIEDELSMSRRYYNGTVRENNICIERFPSNIIASMFHFAKGEFFAINENEKAVPTVSF